jgi:hypothetical protein
LVGFDTLRDLRIISRADVSPGLAAGAVRDVEIPISLLLDDDTLKAALGWKIGCPCRVHGSLAQFRKHSLVDEIDLLHR